MFVEGFDFGITAHANRNASFYYLGVNNGGFFVSQVSSQGDWRTFNNPAHISFIKNRWYIFRIEIKENIFSVYIDNDFLLKQALPTPLINTQGGIGYSISGGEKIYFDDIKVWALK